MTRMFRSVWPWAVLFAGAYLARTAYDWFVPTSDFARRAEVMTYAAVAIMLAAGFWAGWRSGSLLSGVSAGLAMTTMAATMSVIGAALLLAVRHDPATMAAIQGSGGLQEVFLLPILMIGPGMILGAIGGAVAMGARHVRRIDLT